MIKTLIIHTLYFSHALSWNKEIHQIITKLIMRNLSDEAKEDLDRRVILIKGPKQNYKKGAIGIIPDAIKSFGFHLLDDAHHSQIFEEEGIIKGPKSLLKNIVDLRTLLLKKDRVSDFIETLSISYFIHLTQDLFQPFHTFSEGGFKKSIDGKHLHMYWDSLCGGHFGESRKSAIQLISDALENRKVLVGGDWVLLPPQSDHEELLEDFSYQNLLDYLKNKYYSEIGDVDLFDFINNPKFDKDKVIDPEYKKVCMRISLGNIEIAMKMIEKVLKAFYSSISDEELILRYGPRKDGDKDRFGGNERKDDLNGKGEEGNERKSEGKQSESKSGSNQNGRKVDLKTFCCFAYIGILQYMLTSPKG